MFAIAIPTRGTVVSSFYITEDSNPELNGVDSSGRSSVIRDFRSGNLADGSAGKLPDSETPMIVASHPERGCRLQPRNSEHAGSAVSAERGSVLPG